MVVLDKTSNKLIRICGFHIDYVGHAHWSNGTLRDRVDAVIVHEYVEANLQPPPNLRGQAAVDWLHNEAIKRAPDTTMPITAGAKRILTEYRQAAGLGP